MPNRLCNPYQSVYFKFKVCLVYISSVFFLDTLVNLIIICVNIFIMLHPGCSARPVQRD